MRKKLLQVKNKTLSKKEARSQCEDHMKRHLTPTQFTLFQSQIVNADRKEKGRRYTDEAKIIALTLYYKSSRVYDFLRRIFTLPTKTTLIDFLANQRVTEGFNDFVFGALKASSESLTEQEKIVVLSLDGINLVPEFDYHDGRGNVIGHDKETKKPVTQAMVLMVRGLYSEYKQPIYYSFHEPCSLKAPVLKRIIEEAITKLTESGLNVKVIICDQCGSNQGLYNKELKVSKTKPYFLHNGKKVFCLYDTPHLVKSIRNNLQRNNLYINRGKDDEEVVSWKFIIDFYNIDKELVARNANKIKWNHIYGYGSTLMRVYLATQIFSRTVAAAMFGYIKLKGLPEEARSTAKFVQRMNWLFDSLNASSLPDKTQNTRSTTATPQNVRNTTVTTETTSDDDENPSRDNLTKLDRSVKLPLTENSPHLDLWDNVLSSLENMWFYREKKNQFYRPPCLVGLALTISGIVALWTELKQLGYDHLPTGRLNQDPLENFFSQIRYYAGSSNDVTPKIFSQVFKTLMMTCILTPPKHTTNCTIDKDTYLKIFKPGDMRRVRDGTAVVPIQTSDVGPTQFVCNLTPDLTEDSMESIEAVGYTKYASYIGMRLIKVADKCSTCTNMFSSPVELRGTQHTYLTIIQETDSALVTFASLQLIKSVTATVLFMKSFVDEFSYLPDLKIALTEKVPLNVNIKWMETCETHKTITKQVFIDVLRRSYMKDYIKRKNETLKIEAMKKKNKKKVDQLAKGSIKRKLFEADMIENVEPVATLNLSQESVDDSFQNEFEHIEVDSVSESIVNGIGGPQPHMFLTPHVPPKPRATVGKSKLPSSSKTGQPALCDVRTPLRQRLYNDITLTTPQRKVATSTPHRSRAVSPHCSTPKRVKTHSDSKIFHSCNISPIAMKSHSVSPSLDPLQCSPVRSLICVNSVTVPPVNMETDFHEVMLHLPDVHVQDISLTVLDDLEEFLSFPVAAPEARLGNTPTGRGRVLQPRNVATCSITSSAPQQSPRFPEQAPAVRLGNNTLDSRCVAQENMETDSHEVFLHLPDVPEQDISLTVFDDLEEFLCFPVAAPAVRLANAPHGRGRVLKPRKVAASGNKSGPPQQSPSFPVAAPAVRLRHIALDSRCLVQENIEADSHEVFLHLPDVHEQNVSFTILDQLEEFISLPATAPEACFENSTQGQGRVRVLQPRKVSQEKNTQPTLQQPLSRSYPRTVGHHGSVLMQPQNLLTDPRQGSLTPNESPPTRTSFSQQQEKPDTCVIV